MNVSNVKKKGNSRMRNKSCVAGNLRNTQNGHKEHTDSKKHLWIECVILYILGVEPTIFSAIECGEASA